MILVWTMRTKFKYKYYSQGRSSRVNPTEFWTGEELKLLRELRDPVRVQEYLNGLSYNDRGTAMSPRRVMRERMAHCFEGAVFAAAALRMLGHPPLIVDMLAHNDDDHVIAVFRKDGLWGAVAKSNTTMLRYREPVYRNLRELVMSYFEMYFNTDGYKSLISYSGTLNLSTYDRRRWSTTEEELHFIGDRLSEIRHTAILTGAQRMSLSKADPDLMKACFLGSIESGLYKPKPQ
jgi:hypothetical protein